MFATQCFAQQPLFQPSPASLLALTYIIDASTPHITLYSPFLFIYLIHFQPDHTFHHPKRPQRLLSAPRRQHLQGGGRALPPGVWPDIAAAGGAPNAALGVLPPLFFLGGYTFLTFFFFFLRFLLTSLVPPFFLPNPHAIAPLPGNWSPPPCAGPPKKFENFQPSRTKMDPKHPKQN